MKARMKKCDVMILGFKAIPVHRAIATDLIDHVDKIYSAAEGYSPHIFMCDEITIDSVRKVLLEYKDTQCDVIVSIGLTMTQMLQTLYKEKEIGEIPTIFWGIPEADKLGIVASLERPGGYISGVVMAGLSAVKHAKYLQVFQPYIRNIFIPHDPAGLGGVVGKRVQQLAEQLTSVGFIVTTQVISSPEEAFAKVLEHLPTSHAVLLMDGCMALRAERDISNACGMAGRLLLSGIRRSKIETGGEIGAAFVLTCATDAMEQSLVTLLRRWWRDRKSLGMQPVIIVPNDIVGRVNTFMLGIFAPPELLEKLAKCPDLVVEWRWVNAPVMVQPEPKVYDLELLESKLIRKEQ